MLTALRSRSSRIKILSWVAGALDADGTQDFALVRYNGISAPNVAPALAAASDTGFSSTDGITNLTTVTFNVSPYGPYFRLFRNGTLISPSYQTGTTFIATSQPTGTSSYTARSVDAAGNASGLSPVGSVTIDTTLPTTTGISAPNVTTGGGTSYNFTVTFAVNNSVDVTSLDGSDIRVSGPGGFNNVAASFVSANLNTNGTPRTATYSLTPPGGSWDAGDNGTYTIALQGSQVMDVAGNAVNANASLGSFTVNVPGAAAATIAGRFVFYNTSVWDNNDPAANANDDNAIAQNSDGTPKAALLPNTFASGVNITNYTRGLNGVMVDISHLANAANLSATSDFVFKAGTTNTPSNWSAAPTPTLTVRAGKGTGGSDRVELIWPDNAIQNEWLQVTVKAGANTGLSADDVFYFGNLMGDVTYNGLVTGSDVSNVKLVVSTTPTLASPADLNRNGTLTGSDVSLAKLWTGSSLTFFTAPAFASASDAPAASAPVTESSQAAPQARRKTVVSTPSHHHHSLRIAGPAPAGYGLSLAATALPTVELARPLIAWDRSLLVD
jgi:hypothetical protein